MPDCFCQNWGGLGHPNESLRPFRQVPIRTQECNRRVHAPSVRGVVPSGELMENGVSAQGVSCGPKDCTYVLDGFQCGVRSPTGELNGRGSALGRHLFIHTYISVYVYYHRSWESQRSSASGLNSWVGGDSGPREGPAIVNHGPPLTRRVPLQVTHGRGQIVVA